MFNKHEMDVLRITESLSSYCRDTARIGVNSQLVEVHKLKELFAILDEYPQPYPFNKIVETDSWNVFKDNNPVILELATLLKDLDNASRQYLEARVQLVRMDIVKTASEITGLAEFMTKREYSGCKVYFTNAAIPHKPTKEEVEEYVAQRIQDITSLVKTINKLKTPTND